jgi:hypothetical protein
MTNESLHRRRESSAEHSFPGAHRRWEHEDVVERAESRLKDYPEAMRVRQATVEHPFGTLKQWMGSGLLTRQKHNVSTGMSLHVLAYNMKRAVNLVGAKAILEAI